MTSYIEQIKAVKEKNLSFDTDVFGADFGDLFKSPFPHPPVYPTRGKHPRVMVSSHNIDKIRENLEKPQNESAYRSYHEYYKKEMSGEYDVILLLTKQLLNKEVVTLLKDHLEDDGVIVTLQNGLPEELSRRCLGV